MIDISGTAAKLRSRPAKLTRPKSRAPTGSKRDLGAQRGRAAAAAAASASARDRTRARLVGRSRVRTGAIRRDAAPTIANVAPNDSTNPGSRTDSGVDGGREAAGDRERVHRRAAMIETRCAHR